MCGYSGRKKLTRANVAPARKDMLRKFLRRTLIVVGVCLVLSVAAGLYGWWKLNRPLSEDALYELALKNTVYVSCGSRIGTGFIVKEYDRRYLYTCEHCITGDQPITAKTIDGKSLQLGYLSIAKDRDLVKFYLMDKDLEGLRLAEDDVTLMGSTIYAYGDSLGQGVITANKGKVLAVGVDKIEIDAEVQHGNSGGPLLTDKGEVVGMISSGSVAHTEYTKGTRYDGARRFAERLSKVKWLSDYDYDKYMNQYRSLASLNNFLLSVDRYADAKFLDGLLKERCEPVVVYKLPGYIAGDRSWCGFGLDNLALEVNVLIMLGQDILGFDELCGTFRDKIATGQWQFPVEIKGVVSRDMQELEGYYWSEYSKRIDEFVSCKRIYQGHILSVCEEAQASLEHCPASYAGERDRLLERLKAVCASLKADGACRLSEETNSVECKTNEPE